MVARKVFSRWHVLLFGIGLLALALVLRMPPVGSLCAGGGMAPANSSDSILREMEEHQTCIHDAFVEHDRNNGAHSQLARQRDELLAEMKKVIDDLESGKYCSRCWRTAGEIERQEQLPFERHLAKVKGVEERAPAERILQRKKDFLEKAAAIEGRMAAARRANKDLWWKAVTCYNRLEQARFDYWLAFFRARQETAGTRSGELLAITGATFGLGDNAVVSPYEALRVYSENDQGRLQAQRVGTAVGMDPDAIDFLRYHQGVDIRSLNAEKKPVPLPFTAGVSGTAHRVPNSKTNTVEVALENGNYLQYLHASEVYEKSDPPLAPGYWRIVPHTILGKTGDIGSPGFVHLHVQAFDSDRRPIHPAYAAMGKDDPAAIAYKLARNRAGEERSSLPTFRWSVSPEDSVAIKELTELGDAYLDEYFVSPVIRVKRPER